MPTLLDDLFEAGGSITKPLGPTLTQEASKEAPRKSRRTFSDSQATKGPVFPENASEELKELLTLKAEFELLIEERFSLNKYNKLAPRLVAFLMKSESKV